MARKRPYLRKDFSPYPKGWLLILVDVIEISLSPLNFLFFLHPQRFRQIFGFKIVKDVLMFSPLPSHVPRHAGLFSINRKSCNKSVLMSSAQVLFLRVQSETALSNNLLYLPLK